MIVIIARLKMKEGKEEEAMALARSLVQGVQAEESGALAYVCHRSNEEPSELVFFETYTDEDALKAHRKTPHMAVMNKAFAELFDPPVKIERLERVEGFFRS